MLEFYEQPGTNLILVRASGRITRDDYYRITPWLESRMRKHGCLRAMVVISHIDDIVLGVFWDDLKYTLKNGHNFERIAMVGDRRWQQWWMRRWMCPGRLLTPCEMRYFDQVDEDEAEMWVRELAYSHA